MPLSAGEDDSSVALIVDKLFYVGCSWESAVVRLLSSSSENGNNDGSPRVSSVAVTALLACCARGYEL